MNAGKWISVGCVAMVMALVGLMVVGCENSSTNNEIIVSPASKSIYGTDAVVVFTASGKGVADPSGETNRAPNVVVGDLYLPLQWSVSNPELGSIAGREGFTAIYVSTGKTGNQIVTVRDQGDSRGIAVVEQTLPPVAPSTTNGTETVTTP